MTTGNIDRSSSSHQIAQWSEWLCGKNLFIGYYGDRILLKFMIGSLQNTHSGSEKNLTSFLGRLVKWNNMKEKLVAIVLTEMSKLLKISSFPKIMWSWEQPGLQWSHSYRRALPIRKVVTVTVSKRQKGERGPMISRLFELPPPFSFFPTYFFSFLKKDNYFSFVILQLIFNVP